MNNSGLKHRTKCGDAIKNESFEAITLISKNTKIPRSRLIDEAIDEYIEKHYPEYIKKGSE